MLRIADPSAGRRYCTAASFVVLLLLAVAYAHAAPDDGGKRLALVIGNNAYSVHQLQNAVNDARAMNKALLAAGFRTIFRENAKKVAMEQATVELLRAVGPNDTVVFYYAGHAVQIENENMLIPVDFEAADDVVEAKFKSFPFAQLIEQLKRSRAKITIFILDACRSNPLAAKLSLETGLAIPPNPGKETYIAFSTSPNKVATDNPDGKNSWFTDALADLITKPNLSLDETFVGVRKRVLEATKGRQIPWSQTSLTEPFYFLRDKDTIIITSTMRDKWFRDAQQYAQRENWPEAIQSLQDVLKNQPDRLLEQKAKKMLDYVMVRRDALSHFELGDFGAAARLYEQALRVDPFSMDAALEGFNSYLLSDQLPDAVRILKQIRLRGSSTVAGKAQAALKELAAVNPDAEKELKNGIPQPPPIQEILGGTHFGAPDWDAGKRYLQEHPAELARWTKELTPVLPPVIEVQDRTDTTADTASPIILDAFHLEIEYAGSRDTGFMKLSGFLDIATSPAETVVFLNRKQISDRVPVKLELPVGPYKVRSVQQGRLVNTWDVEVRTDGTAEVRLGR